MVEQKRFLVDVGLTHLPFPIRALSKQSPEGQPTVAGISISARIMAEFEPFWIDKFIKIVHSHRDTIGPKSLRKNILDYHKYLDATMVQAGFDYPIFVEKETPVSKAKCLVRYRCKYEAKVSTIQETPKIIFTMELPVITTYPVSAANRPGGLFGQLSVVTLEVEPKADIFPEDLVALIDRNALAPIYSFLDEGDQLAMIQKIHSEEKTSVAMTDDIKTELARNPDIEWYAVRCANFGMLHTYSTVISTERSSWVPFSGPEDGI